MRAVLTRRSARRPRVYEDTPRVYKVDGEAAYRHVGRLGDSKLGAYYGIQGMKWTDAADPARPARGRHRRPPQAVRLPRRREGPAGRLARRRTPSTTSTTRSAARPLAGRSCLAIARSFDRILPLGLASATASHGRTRPGRAPDHLRHLDARRHPRRRRGSSRAGWSPSSIDVHGRGLQRPAGADGDRRASGGPAVVVLHGHIDVVPGFEEQFQPRVEGERLIGRGAYDMKGGAGRDHVRAARPARTSRARRCSSSARPTRSPRTSTTHADRRPGRAAG